jgi:hypothetical protein
LCSCVSYRYIVLGLRRRPYVIVYVYVYCLCNLSYSYSIIRCSCPCAHAHAHAKLPHMASMCSISLFFLFLSFRRLHLQNRTLRLGLVALGAHRYPQSPSHHAGGLAASRATVARTATSGHRHHPHVKCYAIFF